MARASIRTLLSLDRFARIMQINPMHFNGAEGTEFWPDAGACEDVWPQYTWTPFGEEIVSREYLAEAIYSAEQDIMRVLGYPPAPMFFDKEDHQYEKPYRHTSLGYTWRNQRNQGKSISTRFGKIREVGHEARTLVEANVALTFADNDGDGFNETASLSVTTDLDPRELRFYMVGTDADDEFEVRTPTFSESAGTYTFNFDAWLLFDPDAYPITPTRAGLVPINAEDAAVYVSALDVYRVYIDTTQSPVTFFWEDPNCTGPHCDELEQTGCMTVRDPEQGLVVPYPATYDDGWTYTQAVIGREPDRVQLAYQAGAVSVHYERSKTLDPLDHRWAQAIAWMAASRIELPVCGCTNVQNLFKHYQRDMTVSSEGRFFILNLETDIFTNPFGTRVGEYRAWQLVARLNDDVVISGGAL